MQCIHGLWSQALQASMAPLGSALQMGSKERAVYLGHKVLRGVKVRQATASPMPRTFPGLCLYLVGARAILVWASSVPVGYTICTWFLHHLYLGHAPSSTLALRTRAAVASRARRGSARCGGGRAAAWHGR